MKKYLFILWLFSTNSFATSLTTIIEAFTDHKKLQKLNKNYDSYQKELLDSLTKKISEEVYKTTTINDPVATVALAVSYQLFLLQVTLKVARDLVLSSNPVHETKEYINMKNTDFNKTYMRPNVGCMGLIAFSYEHIYKNYNEIYLELKKHIGEQVKNIDLSHAKALELLALLLVQDKMIESHFIKIYHDAYNYINKHHFKEIKSKISIIDYISRHTWGREYLENNIYILSLKNLLQNIDNNIDPIKKHKNRCCCNIF